MTRFLRLLRRLLIAAAVLVPFLSALVIGWYRAHYIVPPEPTEEKIVLPTPNGYDTLLAACQLEVPKHGVITTSPIGGYGGTVTPSPPQPREGRRKLLVANGLAIAKLREALKQEYQVPSDRVSADHFPGYARFREMARMLVFAAQTQADAGHLAEAARCGLDAVELGVVVPRGGMLIGGLVGIACEAIGNWRMWKLVDSLDAPTARAAAKRLAAIEKRRWPLARILGEEKRYSRSTTRKLFGTGPVEAWKSLGYYFDPAGLEFPDDVSAQETPRADLHEKADALWARARAVYYGPRTTLENTERWMNALADAVEKPWSRKRDLPPLIDPVSQQVSFFTGSEFKWVMMRAATALLQVSLALHAYRLEKGSYPGSLSTLVSEGYLDSLPVDPFSPTRAPFSYRQESPGKMTLYSVGPDGKDDGGRPVDMCGKDGKFRRGFVDVDKDGDFVARVNTW